MAMAACTALACVAPVLGSRGPAALLAARRKMLFGVSMSVTAVAGGPMCRFRVGCCALAWNLPHLWFKLSTAVAGGLLGSARWICSLRGHMMCTTFSLMIFYRYCMTLGPARLGFRV